MKGQHPRESLRRRGMIFVNHGRTHRAGGTLLACNLLAMGLAGRGVGREIGMQKPDSRDWLLIGR